MNKLILFFIILLFGCVEDSTKESSCCDDITWDTFGSENYFIPGEMKWSSDRASMTYIIGIEISISSEGRVTELYLYRTKRGTWCDYSDCTTEYNEKELMFE